MYRCKYTSKADIEYRGFFNICETLLVFEEPKARGRMKNKRHIEMLTNAYFAAFNHAEGLVRVEQSIKSKTSKVISSKNKAVTMLDCSGNRSNTFDMHIADPLFQFSHILPVVINTPQWNCYLHIIAQLHRM